MDRPIIRSPRRPARALAPWRRLAPPAMTVLVQPLHCSTCSCATPSFALVAAADDHAVGALVGARLVALRRLTPPRDRMPSPPAAAPPAAQRMIHPVHHHPP